MLATAPMVKWISQLTSDQSFWVRVLVGAQTIKQETSLDIKTGLFFRKQTAFLSCLFVKRSHIFCSLPRAENRRVGTAGT